MNGTWDKLYEYSNHDSSVNSVSFAPHEFGLILACGSSDGTISIISSTGKKKIIKKNVYLIISNKILFLLNLKVLHVFLVYGSIHKGFLMLSSSNFHGMYSAFKTASFGSCEIGLLKFLFL